MDRVSSRHEDSLGGRLDSIDGARPIIVALEIPPEVAASAAVQHTAWMTLNMLARLDRIVAGVSIACSADPPVAGRVSPLAAGAQTLREMLAIGAAAIDTVPVDFDGTTGDLRLVMGSGSPVDSMRVYGEGWCGGIARGREIRPGRPSALPFGPYLAACLAVGEVFRAVRMDPDRWPPIEASFYSAWTHEAAASFIAGGPAQLDPVVLRETLAGVGAVGCICVQCLWATWGLSGDVLLVDGDPDGVEVTNLNRYLLFGRHHLGMQKASTARDLLQSDGIRWAAHDGVLETAPGEHRRILCAVDSNGARLAVQNRWPESLFMASTKDLRAEIVRCDPREDGPCARCYNDPEVTTPDEDRRRMFLKASTAEQRATAEAAGADLSEAIAWARTGECGTSGERVRDALRGTTGVSDMASFAVPFVSCAAGTMLAAEVVKEQLDAPVPLSPAMPHASLQFWRPSASRGGAAYLRDRNCPACRPGAPAAEVWLERMEGRPRRNLSQDHVNGADLGVE